MSGWEREYHTTDGDYQSEAALLAGHVERLADAAERIAAALERRPTAYIGTNSEPHREVGGHICGLDGQAWPCVQMRLYLGMLGFAP